MTDIFDSQKRSDVMRRIRSVGNRSTELRLIGAFQACGITGWRRGSKLLGRPDFVFPKERLCVFVDGCFWHGCPACYRKPKTNVAFWEAKIRRNRKRDRAVSGKLRVRGMAVYRVWECRLASHAVVARIHSELTRRRALLELLDLRMS
jgi:DNA mismatch endonuclease (patch repair protein)